MAANQPARVGKKNVLSHEQKKSVTRVLAQRTTGVNFDKYIQAMIDPRSFAPIVFPAPATTRMGSASFPLVVNLSGVNDYTIIASPSLNNPLQVSSNVTISDSDDNINGMVVCSASDGGLMPTSSMRVTSPCDVVGAMYGERVGIPLTSVAGATVEATFSYTQTDFLYNVQVWVRNTAGTWILTVTTPLQGPGQTDDVSATSIPISPAGPLGTTHISFQCTVFNPLGGNITGAHTAKLGYQLEPTVGFINCASLPSERNLIDHYPDWSNLLQASSSARVVAMDMLITFEGSDLNNEGSLAIANVDNDLIFNGDSATYETVAAYPFDKYRGRLSKGGHWHFVPSSFSQLEMYSLENSFGARNLPHGVCGITGANASAPIRIEVNIMVNFFSDDPSYSMKISPSIHGFPDLLHLLRKDVPLVSANDSHLQKLAKFAKEKAKQGLTYASENPEQVAKAITMLLALL